MQKKNIFCKLEKLKKCCTKENECWSNLDASMFIFSCVRYCEDQLVESAVPWCCTVVQV